MINIKKLVTIAGFFCFCNIYADNHNPNLKSVPTCDASLEPNQNCYIPVNKLRPTQIAVGHFQAENKQLQELKGIVSSCDILAPFFTDGRNSGKSELKEYSTAECYNDELKDFLKDPENQVPVISNLGDQKFYVTDHHHLSFALLKLFSEKVINECLETNKDGSTKKCYPRVYALIQEKADYGTSTEFWTTLLKENRAWPYTLNDEQTKYLPVKIEDYENVVPKTIADLKDDPYRSIYGLARSLDPLKYSKPSGDGIFFYQFKWAACVLDSKLNKPLSVSSNEMNALGESSLTLNYQDAIIEAKYTLQNTSLFDGCSKSDNDMYKGLPIPKLK